MSHAGHDLWPLHRSRLKVEMMMISSRRNKHESASHRMIGRKIFRKYLSQNWSSLHLWKNQNEKFIAFESDCTKTIKDTSMFVSLNSFSSVCGLEPPWPHQDHRHSPLLKGKFSQAERGSKYLPRWPERHESITYHNRTAQIWFRYNHLTQRNRIVGPQRRSWCPECQILHAANISKSFNSWSSFEAAGSCSGFRDVAAAALIFYISCFLSHFCYVHYPALIGTTTAAHPSLL